MKTVTKYILVNSLIAVLTISIFAFYSLHQYYDAEEMEESKNLEKCMLTFRELLRSKGEGFRIVNGKLLAGSYQLNGNFDVPDKIQEIFGGVATIFMGDVRVSTNVLDNEGKRAVGTRLVGPAYDAIFKEEKPFRGEAAILGIRYLTAYDPIRDSNGEIIGVLFVGLKKSEFLAGLNGLKVHLILTLFGMVTVFTIFMVLLGRDTQKVERENEHQLRFLQTLIDTIPSPIFFKDAACRYLGCNKAFEAYVGYSQDELIGKTPHELWPEELADRYRQQDLALLENPGLQVYESTVKYADGTLREVIFNKATFNESDGSVGGLVGVILDITERKMAEDATQNAYHARMMQSFMIRLGHDLRTPLTPLTILLPLIRKRAADHELRKLVDICCKSTTSMKKLADKAQLLGSLSATIRTDDLERITLVSLVELSLADCGDILAQKNVTCQNDVDPSVVVQVMPGQLKELFANLISNAARFLPENGSIRIAAEQQGGTVTVAVHDDGIGLAHDHLERIFDEFFKADESRHDLDAPGLGLTICKRIVLNHHGRIWAESPGIGKGTTIKFTINEQSADSRHNVKEPK